MRENSKAFWQNPSIYMHLNYDGNVTNLSVAKYNITSETQQIVMAKVLVECNIIRYAPVAILDNIKSTIRDEASLPCFSPLLMLKEDETAPQALNGGKWQTICRNPTTKNIFSKYVCTRIVRRTIFLNLVNCYL